MRVCHTRRGAYSLSLFSIVLYFPFFRSPNVLPPAKAEEDEEELTVPDEPSALGTDFYIVHLLDFDVASKDRIEFFSREI